MNLLKLLETLPAGKTKLAVMQGEEKVSYRALAAHVRQAEKVLLAVPPRSVIGVRGFISWRWVVALLAIWRRDAVFMPLNGATEPRDEHLLPDWELRVDETEEPFRLVDRPGKQSAGLPPEVAYLMPTSGSTGPPKWIMGSLRGVGHFVDWEVKTVGVTSADRVSLLTPPTFDPVFRDVLVPLVAGATLCVPPASLVAGNTSATLDWIASTRVTVVHTIPTMVRAWCREPTPLSDLRILLLAGEPLFGSDIRRWRTSFGDQAQLVNLYGPSETTLAKCAHFVGRDSLGNHHVPVGRPIPGAGIAVIRDDGQICDSYELGEVLVRTRYRSLGYWHDPVHTADRFVRNPLGPNGSEKVFRTGDLGYLTDAGELVIVGRTDDEYKLRGVRVDLGRIEDSLRAIEQVRDVAVRVEDVEGSPSILCAYLVTGSHVDVIRQEARGRLPRSWWPHAWVRVQSLPRTHTGKVDRARLPAPQRAATIGTADASVVAVLQAIWREVFPYARDIGTNEGFYELGGQSLEAAQILVAIEAQLGVSLSLADFYELRTIDRLAEHVQHVRETPATGYVPPLERRQGTGAVPLTGAQLRFWSWIRRTQDHLRFQFIWAILIQGVDSHRLRSAIADVLGRHPALFARTLQRDDAVLQEFPVPEPYVEFSTIDTGYSDEALDRTKGRALRDCARPFILEEGPLVRAMVYGLGNDHCVFALNNHILASDGWTKGIIVRNIARQYEEVDPAPEPVRFRDYALWEQSCRQAWKRHEHFWADALGSLRPPRLPYDRPIGLALRGSCSLVRHRLGGQLMRRLNEAAAVTGVTVASVHLAALTRSLHEWSGERDGHVVLSNARRMARELNDVVGCFTDSMVYTYDVEPAQPMVDHVVRTHRNLAEHLDHAAPTYEYLMSRIRPDVDRYSSEWFPVIFAPQPDLAAELKFRGASVRMLPWSFRRWIWAVEVYPVFGDDWIDLNVTFADELFDRSNIERMVDGMVSSLRDYAG